MKLKYLLLFPVLAITANAATVSSGDGSVANPLIIDGIIGQPNVTAVLTFTNQAGDNTGFSIDTPSAPYTNLDNNVRFDSDGGSATVAFFTDFVVATGTGTAFAFTGDLNFFDVDTFTRDGDPDSVDEITLAVTTGTIDGGATAVLDGLDVDILNTNTRQEFIDAGFLTSQLVGVEEFSVESTGDGTFILDIGTLGQSIPEPSSTALLGLGGLALLARRRR